MSIGHDRGGIIVVVDVEIRARIGDCVLVFVFISVFSLSRRPFEETVEVVGGGRAWMSKMMSARCGK